MPSLLSSRKLKKNQGLLIAGALAVLGILLVVWVRAGSNTARTVTLNWKLSTGQSKSGRMQLPQGKWRVCFDNVRLNAPSDEVSFYARTLNYSGAVQVSRATKADLLGDPQGENTICLKPAMDHAPEYFSYGAKVTSGHMTIQRISVFPDDVTAPSPPTKLSARKATSSSVKLRWLASYDEGVGPVSKYYIYRMGKKVGEVDRLLFNPDNVPYSTYLDRKRVRPNTWYSYQVAGVDQAGNVSKKSNTIRVKTQGQ